MFPRMVRARRSNYPALLEISPTSMILAFHTKKFTKTWSPRTNNCALSSIFRISRFLTLNVVIDHGSFANLMHNKFSYRYESRGLLNMVSRNMKVKTRPQRFQDELNAQFELIFTFELRVFDLVVEGTPCSISNFIYLTLKPTNQKFEMEIFNLAFLTLTRNGKDLRNRESTTHNLVHVINFETTDTQQDAAEGAKEAYELLQIVCRSSITLSIPQTCRRYTILTFLPLID